MKFKDKFRYCRKTFGYTQQQVANKLNVSKRLIAYYESGEREPGKELVGEISHLFQTPLTYFLLDVETDPGQAFFDEADRVELNRYKELDITKDTMRNILAAGGDYINPEDPLYDIILESVARVLMNADKKTKIHTGDEDF